MERAEAVALLKELGVGLLIQPTMVMIEKRTPDRYQLRIQGNYDRNEIERFVQKFYLSVKEDKAKNYLFIFKP
jgi:hypothetical protein